MKTTRLLIAIPLSCGLLVGCNEKTDPEEAPTVLTEEDPSPQTEGGDAMDELGRAAGEFGRAAEDAARAAWEDFRAEASQELDVLQTEFLELKGASEKTADGVFSGILEELDEKLKTARSKLIELSEASEDEVEVLKGEVRQLEQEIAGLIQQGHKRLEELGVQAPEVDGTDTGGEG
jgi:hypothetical protein